MLDSYLAKQMGLKKAVTTAPPAVNGHITDQEKKYS